MRLFWTETAKKDLRAIRRYIATDNPTAAKRRNKDLLGPGISSNND